MKIPMDTAKPEAPDRPVTVQEGYAACKQITRRNGPNFSLGFIFLPRAKQDAIHAIYAFCRIADDIVDESTDEERRPRLEWWREELQRCFAGEPSHPVTVALADAAARYPIPEWPLAGLIDGCRDDLSTARYETFDDLLGYCDKVASTISVLSLSVFGARSEEAYVYGKMFSTALQLSNIIRDVGGDLKRERIYIPLEEIRRFGCSEEEILGRKTTPAFQDLMRFQVDRALSYFDRSYLLIDLIDPDARRAVHLMGAVYCAILHKIQRADYSVYDQEASLTLLERIRVAAASFRNLGKGFQNGS